MNQPPRRVSKGTLRPMVVADTPAIARLFLTAFRGKDARVSAEFVDYLKRLLFGCPHYSPSAGSMVYEQEGQAIGAAILAVPMRYAAFDRIVTGRLLFAFMAEPGDRSSGAARVTLALRPKQYDFSFTDSASPTSRRHFKAIGALDFPMHGLEWRRSFRPLGFLGRLAERFVPGLGALRLPALTYPLDSAIRTVLTRYTAPEVAGIRDTEMTPADFVEHAPRFIAHYAVRPVWSADEVSWLVQMASENATDGPLRIRAVLDRAEAVIGCFIYYGEAGRTARILNIIPAKGKEMQVVGAMFRHLDRAGCVGAVGRALPTLMDGLVRQRTITFRHAAFVCLATSHPDIGEAVKRGDVFIGGLAGEGWSRLMSDFR